MAADGKGLPTVLRAAGKWCPFPAIKKRPNCYQLLSESLPWGNSCCVGVYGMVRIVLLPLVGVVFFLCQILNGSCSKPKDGVRHTLSKQTNQITAIKGMALVFMSPHLCHLVPPSFHLLSAVSAGSLNFPGEMLLYV